jgi:hypothetical protein
MTLAIILKYVLNIDFFGIVLKLNYLLDLLILHTFLLKMNIIIFFQRNILIIF